MDESGYEFEFLDEADVRDIVRELAATAIHSGSTFIMQNVVDAIQAVQHLDRVLATSVSLRKSSAGPDTAQ
ncbi:MAG: hypothetical protein V4801_02525 [Burkholderia gladioli]